MHGDNLSSSPASYEMMLPRFGKLDSIDQAGIYTSIPASPAYSGCQLFSKNPESKDDARLDNNTAYSKEGEELSMFHFNSESSRRFG